MKRICFLFNHFQFQDGVCRSAIAMANLMADRKDVEVTLFSIYKFEKETLNFLNPNIKTRNIFGIYFKGFSNVVGLIPMSWLYKYYFKNKYDIEIAFQYGTSYKILTACSKPNEVKRIGWMHAYDNTYKKYYLKMDQIVSVAKGNVGRIINDLEKKIPVTYNYNPIDDIVVREQGCANINFERIANGVQFVTIGRLSPEKGYRRLIVIMSRLKKEGYRFNLWILGSGQEEKVLQNQIEELDLSNDIMLMGAQRNPHAFTSKADVFICSSFSEGYSTACTEAIMLGVPVVTTNVSGGAEIIDEATCGILTEMDDESLYQGIKKVLDNPELVEYWKETLLRTRERFSAQTRFEQLKKILELN